MSIYAHIKRCLELSDRDVASALADRRMAKALLDQLANVSRPGDGAPKLLLVFARLAGGEIDWIDGALRVEMVGDADVTVVEVLSELGLGMRERVFPSFKMNAPLEEFARAVERVPHMVAPLTIATTGARRLVLTASVDEEEEEATPSVAIDDDSLYTRKASKEKPSAVKEIELPPAPPPPPHPATPSAAKIRVAKRVSSRPAPEESKPAAKTKKSLRPAPPPPDHDLAPAFPKAPAVPRTEERPAAAQGAARVNRAVVAKVPLTRIKVPRGSRPPMVAAVEAAPPARASKPPKRPSLKPAAAAKRSSSKPPAGVRSAAPGARSAAPNGRSAAPKGAGRSRSPAAMSEPPDEEGIDMGWDEGNE